METCRTHKLSIEKSEGAKIFREERFYSFQAVTEGGDRLKRMGEYFARL